MDLIFSAIVLFGVGIITIPFSISKMNLHTNCRKKIKATIIGMDSYSGEDSPTQYYPYYEYTYKSKTYQIKASLPLKRSDKRPTRIGSIHSIYIDPQHPRTCIPYRLGKGERTLTILGSILLTLFEFAFGAFLIFHQLQQ